MFHHGHEKMFETIIGMPHVIITLVVNAKNVSKILSRLWVPLKVAWSSRNVFSCFLLDLQMSIGSSLKEGLLPTLNICMNCDCHFLKMRTEMVARILVYKETGFSRKARQIAIVVVLTTRNTDNERLSLVYHIILIFKKFMHLKEDVCMCFLEHSFDKRSKSWKTHHPGR